MEKGDIEMVLVGYEWFIGSLVGWIVIVVVVVTLLLGVFTR